MSQGTNISAVILAAGESTRMKSDTSKVLFPLCGRPMIEYVLHAASAVNPQKIVMVIGHHGEKVSGWVKDGWAKGKEAHLRPEYAWQTERRGTGHATSCALPLIPAESDHVLILCGDTPLLTGELLNSFVKSHFVSGAPISLVTATVDEPGDYGRIRRDEKGNVTGIVEARELTGDDKQIKEINAGLYIANRHLLSILLSELSDDNSKGEFYLTDIIEKGVRAGYSISSFFCEDPAVIRGVNDRYSLSIAEGQLRERFLHELCLSGVTIRDIRNTHIDLGVRVGVDTVIEPGTFLKGRTSIGRKCIIGPNSEISNSQVGDNSRIWHSVIEGAKIGENVTIGPFSHIRPDSVIKAGASVGNFAEIKNSTIGRGSKVHHHSYIGDSFVGCGANIGAGTVTVNYDGIKKHRTVMEDKAFIGCNANLVAPVRIGKGAYVAAGSTITKDVPDGSLGIARERQVNKEGWVAKHKEKTD